MAIENVWLIRTVVLRARSAELRTVDDAVNVWATQGQGVKDQNMRAVWTAFSAWKTARPNDTYGGCVRRKLGSRTSGTLGLAGIVDIRFGRAFLGKGSYEKTSDDTVATLVHEFAHGALRAVDVPDVDANGNFQCMRVSDDPADPDFGNSTDAMHHQCSNEAMDKILARFHPDYAAVNADNYAQFTKAIMISKRR